MRVGIWDEVMDRRGRNQELRLNLRVNLRRLETKCYWFSVKLRGKWVRVKMGLGKG